MLSVAFRPFDVFMSCLTLPTLSWPLLACPLPLTCSPIYQAKAQNLLWVSSHTQQNLLLYLKIPDSLCVYAGVVSLHTGEPVSRQWCSYREAPCPGYHTCFDQLFGGKQKKLSYTNICSVAFSILLCRIYSDSSKVKIFVDVWLFVSRTRDITWPW